ncbi:MAG: TonB-dependent siderophore receptor [Parvibaculaceae bacterium]|nr:TonB-dependent siderophore receptor [Parvibaculaceae bacterium]
MTHKFETKRLFLSAIVAATTLAPIHAFGDEVTELDPILVTTEQEGVVHGYVAKDSAGATKTNTPLIETPFTVNVIGAEQMADQAVSSVAEALAYTPNVLTNYRGISNLHDEVFVRGYEYAAKFLNGMEFGDTSFGQLDPYLFERIEVIKGPNSVLYGQVMPGGLINQVSKRPTGETKNQVMISYGTDNYMQIGADVQGTANEEGTLAYRFVTTLWNKELQGEDFVQNRILLAPSVIWAVTPQTDVVVDFIYQKEPDAGQRNFYTQKGTLEASPGGYYYDRDLVSVAPEYDKLERDTTSASLEISHEFTDALSFHSQLRYTEINLLHQGVYIDNLFTGDAAPLGVVYQDDEFSQWTTDNYFVADVDIGSVGNKFLFGVDHKSQTLTNNNRTNWSTTLVYDLANPQYITLADDPASFLNGDWITQTDVKQTGIYLQDQISIDNLHIVLGGRYDWANTDVKGITSGSLTEYDDEAFTWRVGASYLFENGFAPYFSYSTSFEPVNRNGGPSGGGLEPSEGEQYEVGVKWESANGQMMVTASYFDISQSNLTEYDSVLGYNINIGTRESTGFELEGKAQVTDKFAVIAAAGLLDAKMTEGEYAGFAPSRIPNSTASVWLKYEFLDGVDGSLGWRYVGESYGDFAEDTIVPDYNLFDVGLSADLSILSSKLAGARASVNVSNLADKTYVASCTEGWDDYCWYGEGRKITARLTYDW